MRTDPEPQEPIFDFHGENTVMQPDTRLPEAPDLLEVEGRMSRVLLQPGVRAVSQRARCREETDRAPRRLATHSASKRRGATLSMVAQCLLSEGIKLAASGVTLELPIPRLPIEFRKPGTELGKLLA